MIELNPNRARKIIVPGAFFFLALLAVCIHSMELEVILTPPGLRPVKDPLLVIPAEYAYSNQPISIPAYRDSAGDPAEGWSDKFVDTRRFASNQSAWIYFRVSDLQHSVWTGNEASGQEFRFCPSVPPLSLKATKEMHFRKRMLS